MARDLSRDGGWGASVGSSVALHMVALAGLYVGSWWWNSDGRWQVVPPEQGVNSAASIERQIIEVAAPTSPPAAPSDEPVEIAALPAPRPAEPTPERIVISPLGTLPPPSAPLANERWEVATTVAAPSLESHLPAREQAVELPAHAFATLPRQSRERTPSTMASAAAAKLSPTATAASVASNPSRGAESLPAPVFNPTPTYPPQLMARRIEGLVKLRVELDDAGRVVRAAVSKTSGYAAFDSAALEVIYRWRFTPTSAAAPTQRALTVPIRFGIVE